MWTIALVLSLVGGEVSLALKGEVTVRRADIYLRDVLTADSYHRLAELGLQNTRVGRGPGFNMSRPVSRALVAGVLAHALPDVATRFSGPDSVLVHRVGGSFSEKDVEEAVRAFITDRAAETVDGEVEIMGMRVPTVLKVPPGPVDYRVRARGNKPLIGRQAFYVDMLVEDRNFRTLVVTVELAQKTMVPVATDRLIRGEALDEDNVTWEYRLLDRATSAPLSYEDAEDMQLRTTVQAGSVLTARHVEAVPLVERNDMVQVVVRRGALSVSLKALAMDRGGKGDRIRLKNTDSGQMMHAVVTAPGTATLSY